MSELLEEMRELREYLVRCMEGENAHMPGPCPEGGSEEGDEEEATKKPPQRSRWDIEDDLEKLRRENLPPKEPKTEAEIAAVAAYSERTVQFVSTLIDFADGPGTDDEDDFIVSHRRETMKENFASALKYATPMMQRRIRSNLGDVTLYASSQELTEAVGRTEGMCGGFYKFNRSERTGALHLDGGWPGDPDSAPEIFAHELGHVIDGPGHIYSNSDEWKQAWSEEINQESAPLSQYARTSPSEGWAEFSRLLLMGAFKPARLDYPKCYAFWKKVGLL